jgi:hypothetical protein
VSDSWETFAAALQEESTLLSRVAESAQALTQALVENDIDKIRTTERQLDTARQA